MDPRTGSRTQIVISNSREGEKKKKEVVVGRFSKLEKTPRKGSKCCYSTMPGWGIFSTNLL